MMNNANNFGMNPMGMNNMMVNNNQQVLMDQTALNIKSIIEPYENKIRELEEIIKQKDFEITVLKQKLNNNFNKNNNLMNVNPMMNMNINPMMNMNMNPWMNMNMNPWMNIYNPMENPFSYEKEEEITIKIQNKITNITCLKNEKFSNFMNHHIYLTYNYKLLSEEKTLEENGIMNGSTIYITDPIYRLTFGASNGKKIFIALDGDCPLEQAIKFYCEQFKDNNIYPLVLNRQITFIYNAVILNIHDKTPIKRVFKGTIPIILVNDSNNVIGG